MQIKFWIQSALGTFSSRALALFKWVIVNHIYGAQADVYHASYSNINHLRKLITEGALNNAFVPIYARALAGEDTAAAQRFACNVTSLFLGISSGLSALFMLGAPWVLPWLLSGFSEERLHQSIVLSYIMAPSLIFLFLFSMAMGILNTRHRFFSSAMGPALSNLIFMAFPLLFARAWGITALAYGVLAGSVAMFALQAVSLYRSGFRYRWVWNMRDPHLKPFFALFVPAIGNILLQSVAALAFVYFASFMAAGSLTLLRNANILAQAPVGVIGVSLANVLLPFLSRDAGKPSRASLAKGMRFFWLMMGPVVVFYACFPEVVVDLVFRDMDLLLTKHTGAYEPLFAGSYAATQVYAWAILPWALQAMETRILFARKDSQATWVLTALMVVVSVAGYAWAKDAVDLAWADVWATWLYVLLGMAWLHRKHGISMMAGMARAWFPLAVGLSGAYLAARAWEQAFQGTGLWFHLGLFGIFCGAYVIITSLSDAEFRTRILRRK